MCATVLYERVVEKEVVAPSRGFDWSFVLSVNSFVLALGFSMAVGIIFGLYPAQKAAKPEPIAALRYE